MELYWIWNGETKQQMLQTYYLSRKKIISGNNVHNLHFTLIFLYLCQFSSVFSLENFWVPEASIILLYYLLLIFCTRNRKHLICGGLVWFPVNWCADGHGSKSQTMLKAMAEASIYKDLEFSSSYFRITALREYWRGTALIWGSWTSRF